MSESEQENLYQAMDRFVRLSRALPETEMTLVEWHTNHGYMVIVGTKIPRAAMEQIQVNGRIVIRATWSDLVNWFKLVRLHPKEEVKIATDS